MSTANAPTSRVASVLRAAAMTVGAGILYWKTGALWAVTLVLATGGLLALALVLPRTYAPVSRALDGIQHASLRVVTWVLLALVFVAVFVPGRLLFRRGRSEKFDRTRRTDTYWKSPRAVPGNSFDKQY